MIIMPRALLIIKNDSERRVAYCIKHWLLYKGVEVIEIHYKGEATLTDLPSEIDILVIDSVELLKELSLKSSIIVVYSGKHRDDVPVSFDEDIIVLHRRSGLYMLFRILEHYMDKKGLLLHTPVLREEPKPP